MKKIILIIFTLLIITTSKAQYFPFQPISDIPYYSSENYHTRVLILDSTIYENRKCLQSLNVITGQTEYHWNNYYQLNTILPDFHGNYIYLRSNKVIGVYDSLLHEHVNFSTSLPANTYFNDIGISPNGNIWALTLQQLIVYRGSSQVQYSFNNYSKLKVIDDTSVYISGYPFYRFHNGIFDSLFTMPPNTYFADWDTDSLGNLWIAGKNKLLYFNGTTFISYDSTNTPIGTDKFNKVVVGKNGHIWTCGEMGKLLEFNGAIWLSHSLPGPYIYIDNFNLDSLSHPWVIAGGYNGPPFVSYNNMSVYVWNGSGFNAPVGFPFMPYTNIKALSPNSVANDEGVFTLLQNLQSFQVDQFFGSPDKPEATDVNCFTAYSQYQTVYNFPFGTNSGIYSIYGPVSTLDTSVLPSDTVNYILNNNGSDYVCTNNGLLVYNGIFYNILNTSNSPLPSNKITFAKTVQGNPYNKLYIGTDNGIAIYSNNQWTVFDSTDLGISNFYVTGILPPQWDTTTYITTMGSGLIKLYNSGNFEILNTTNGNFEDDSLYYATYIELGKCGEYVLIGTKEHGVAAYDYWMNGFEYFNTSNGYPFSESRAAIDNTNYNGIVLIGTNTGLYWASQCGGINEMNARNSMTVYPNPSSGIFNIETPSGSKLEIYNVMGELIYKSITAEEKTTIDLSTQAKGMYFIKMADKNQLEINKKIIVQ
jgi:hypothetical protein